MKYLTGYQPNENVIYYKKIKGYTDVEKYEREFTALNCDNLQIWAGNPFTFDYFKKQYPSKTAKIIKLPVD